MSLRGSALQITCSIIIIICFLHLKTTYIRKLFFSFLFLLPRIFSFCLHVFSGWWLPGAALLLIYIYLPYCHLTLWLETMLLSFLLLMLRATVGTATFKRCASSFFHHSRDPQLNTAARIRASLPACRLSTKPLWKYVSFLLWRAERHKRRQTEKSKLIFKLWKTILK